MAKKSDPCEYCGGEVRTRRVTVDLRQKGRRCAFENVPVGVCVRCGERYYPGPLLERLAALAEHGVERARMVRVPTLDYSKID
ncbi:MAG: YgiT-type zinc finger protein [Planctomycetes bacterium]|nr:YgiT-type zinc finger protein [Planctomycetota bacterium]